MLGRKIVKKRFTKGELTLQKDTERKKEKQEAKKERISRRGRSEKTEMPMGHDHAW